MSRAGQIFFLLLTNFLAFCGGYIGPCQPGEFWNPESWKCLPCRPGEYMGQINHQNRECLPCSSPSDPDIKYGHKVLKENCTSASNTKFRCEENYCEIPAHHNETECQKCDSSDKMRTESSVRPKPPPTTAPGSLHYLEAEGNISEITLSRDLNDTVGVTEPTNDNNTQIHKKTNSTDEIIAMAANEDLSPGTIAGIVIGVIIFIILVVFLVIMILRKCPDGVQNAVRYSEASQNERANEQA